MKCMHLKKLRVLSSFRGPDTHVRHARGQQRAGAVTGSINFFGSTIITLYEVEHQKTFNTKLGKQTIWSSEAIKIFHHHFQEKKAGKNKQIEGKLHCISNAYESMLQKLISKK